MKIYCDTHVHCYDFENFDHLLDSAYKNLHRQSILDGAALNASYLLFFTDGKTDKTWNKLQERVKNKLDSATWSLFVDDENLLVYASKEQQTILLAPARQVISQERLELLLLGCDLEIEDGAPAAEIIENNQQYVVICPWAVGKWLGGRGQILTALIKQFSEKLFLGDNASRPYFWRYVPHFKETINPIFNGSDPLPLKGEVNRIGRFGLMFEYNNNDELNRAAVSLTSILKHLKDPLVKKYNFGQLFSIIPFFQTQLALRRLK